MDPLGHCKVKEILESAFSPFHCEVKYWGGSTKYMIVKLSDKSSNFLGAAKKGKVGLMLTPKRLRAWVFDFRNQLKKEQGLKFSVSDEMIESMIGQGP